MSTSTPAIEAVISSLSALEEFPLSIYDTISRKRKLVDPKGSLKYVEVKLVRPGKTELFISSDDVNPVFREITIRHSTSSGADMTISRKLDGSWFCCVNEQFDLDVKQDGTVTFISRNKRVSKRAPSKESVLKLHNKIFKVAQRYLTRVVTVDKF